MTITTGQLAILDKLSDRSRAERAELANDLREAVRSLVDEVRKLKVAEDKDEVDRREHLGYLADDAIAAMYDAAEELER